MIFCRFGLNVEGTINAMEVTMNSSISFEKFEFCYDGKKKLIIIYYSLNLIHLSLVPSPDSSVVTYSY